MSLDFFNIKINETKYIQSSLKAIFGINYPTIQQVYKLLGLNKKKNWTLNDLNASQIQKIKTYFPELTLFDADLKKKISIEKEKFFELKCYKRNRFLLNLPGNGQRTRSNANTRRKLKN